MKPTKPNVPPNCLHPVSGYFVFPFAVSLSLLFAAGCDRRPANAPPTGTFRLVAGNPTQNATSRTIPLKVIADQPARVTVVCENQGRSEVNGQLLISAADKLREAQIDLTAVRTNSPNGPSIQAGFHMHSEGGDGDMLIKGSFESDGTRLYPAPADPALEHFMTVTATNGVYPLNQPLEIARIDGQPVTITVGDEKK